MMWTAGGQPGFSCVARGGGGKGGGGGGSQAAAAPAPIVLTDPVNGKSFVQQPSGGGMLDQYAMDTGQYHPGPSAQDQLNAEIADRQKGEKATSDAAAAQKTADAAAAETKFQGSRQSAYDTAMQNAIRSFQLQGVDPNQYMESDIKPALQRQFQSVADLDPNPTAAFAPNLGDTIVNNVTGGRRTQALNQLNSIFTPTYAQDAFQPSALDPYVSNIVGAQFDPLSAQLQNAQKRGTLNDTGYQAAVDALNAKRTAATSTVRNLGQGILSKDQSDLNSYITGARGDVNNLTLGGAFDPNTYASGAQTKVNSAMSGLGGELSNAVGDTQYANLSDLINAGGAVQGSQNPSASNPAGGPVTAGGGNLSPAFQSADVLANQKRGLGNVGAF